MPKVAAMKQIGTRKDAGLHDEGRAAGANFKKSISKPVFRSWIVTSRLHHLIGAGIAPGLDSYPIMRVASEDEVAFSDASIVAGKVG
jgi:hypothetical protein